VIKRKEFADDDATFFTTEEHWGMDCGGVAQLRIHEPRWAHNQDYDVWDLFLTPQTARNLAQELMEIANSVEIKEIEFERNGKK
jgi:hypothetical protein